jgi:esterase/lipase superfamily enzyme
VVLQRVTPATRTAVLASIRNAVGRSSEQSLLVFVHGFNVPFGDAARRTAQIAHDLQYPGVPLLFSWPSNGSPAPRAYKSDENDADWAVPHLSQFLQDVARQSGATKINIIAHSMGIETIDASQVDTDWLGHSYFAETTQLIHDLVAVVRHNQPPSQRLLRRRTKGQLTYWMLPR